jgi:ABC-type lipoprotein export system ATPase subunit
MSILTLDHVTRAFKAGASTVRAVDNMSLDVADGELVIVMGPSGSGKTTLLQLLGVLPRPTSGQVRIRDRDTSRLSTRDATVLRLREIGFIFQSFNLFASLSAQENVALPAAPAGMGRRERMARADDLLTRLGLGDRLGHRPHQLSGGEQQRVAVARALVNDPPCYWPTSRPQTWTRRRATRCCTCWPTSPPRKRRRS